MKITRTILASIALTCALATPARAKLTSDGSAFVEAVVRTNTPLKVTATGTQVRVSEPGAVHIVVPISSLTTGIGLRDKHMKEKYLEAGKYPNAELEVQRAALKFPADGMLQTADAQATLTLHGQTRPVTIQYTASRTGDLYSVSGTTRINILDFAITQPSYLGVTVKPDVSISIRFQTRDSI